MKFTEDELINKKQTNDLDIFIISIIIPLQMSLTLLLKDPITGKAPSQFSSSFEASQ